MNAQSHLLYGGESRLLGRSELSYRQGNSFCSLMSPFTKPQLKRPQIDVRNNMAESLGLQIPNSLSTFYGWSLLSLAVSRRVPGVVAARSDEPFPEEEEKEMTWKLLS
jgi:hypothetical protein